MSLITIPSSVDRLENLLSVQIRVVDRMMTRLFLCRSQLSQVCEGDLLIKAHFRHKCLSPTSTGIPSCTGYSNTSTLRLKAYAFEISMYSSRMFTFL